MAKKKNKINGITVMALIIGLAVGFFISNTISPTPDFLNEKGTTTIVFTGIELEGSGFDSELELCESTSRIFAPLFPPISCEFKNSKLGGIDCFCKI